MKLNVGAGQDIRPKDEGWVNCDIRFVPGVDVICDTRDLPFANDLCDEVLAYDILEHVSLYEAPTLIREWKRVLRPGGTLSLRLPDVKRIALALLSGRLTPSPDRVQKANPLLGHATGDDVAIWLFYGDQSPEWGGSEFGSHKSGYTAETLERLLIEGGFESISITSDPAGRDKNLWAEAVKP